MPLKHRAMEFPEYNLAEMTAQGRENIAEALRALRDTCPTLLCGLNIGQLRAIRAAYTRNAEGLLPHVALITPANGWGKTQLIAQDIVGWTKGPQFLKSQHIHDIVTYLGLEELSPGAPFPQEVLDFYASLSDLRDRGKLRMRLVCDADDMKEGGSMLDAVKDWIPGAELTQMDTQKCYRQIIIPHPSIPRIYNVISVKTFNQEVRKHAGPTVRRVWVNEPMPHDIWGETVARTRTKAGEEAGTIMFCATVLNQAPYVADLIGNPRNIHVSGGCWENCAGEEVTDAMALELEKHCDVKLEKNPNGPGYITFGILSKTSIDDIFSNISYGSMEELEARKFGKILHLEGRLFSMLRPDVHRIPDERYLGENRFPEDWPVIQIVDPHDRHPDFSIWLLVTPSMNTITIAEHPRVNNGIYFWMMKNRVLDIEQTCDAWRTIESDLGISHQVVARIGDPNKFNDPQPRTMQTLWWDYAQFGFKFDLNVTDDLAVGHAELLKYIRYNSSLHENNPMDPLGLPKWFCLAWNLNSWEALVKYSWKERKDLTDSLSEQIDQKYKGPVDVHRYGHVWLRGRSWEAIRPKNRQSTVDAIKRGRIPSRFRIAAGVGFSGINLKHRHLVGTTKW